VISTGRFSFVTGAAAEEIIRWLCMLTRPIKTIQARIEGPFSIQSISIWQIGLAICSDLWSQERYHPDVSLS
jgi:hypothetical protein